MKRILLVLVAVSTAGCYTYARVDPVAVPEGERLRLVVTPEGARELTEVTGTDGPIPTVEGRLDRRDESVLVLRVPVVSPEPGRTAVDQLVRVPMEQVLAAERRDVDPWATGLAVAGGVGLGVGVVLLIMEAWGSGVDGPGDDIDVFFAVPIG